MKRHVATAAAASLILLVGCGTTDGPSTEKLEGERDSPPASSGQKSESNGADGFGEYIAVNDDGAEVRVTVTTPATSSDVAKVEQFRQTAKVRPFVYVTGVLDNRGTHELYTLEAGVRIVTDAGRQVNLPHVAAPEDGVFEKYILDKVDAAWPYYEKFYDRQTISPSAKEPVIFATAEKVPSVKSVWVIFEQYGTGVQAWRSDEEYRP